MNQIYHFIGLLVFWPCAAYAAWRAIKAIWTYGIAKLPPWPWLMWLCFYVYRICGHHRYKQCDWPLPVLYNSTPYWRIMTKQNRALARKMQANTIRYNRRRWAAQIK